MPASKDRRFAGGFSLRLTLPGSPSSLRRVSETERAVERTGRLFRRVFTSIYGLVALAFSLLIILGVVRGLTEIRGPRPAPKLGASACLDELETLREELLDRLAAFPRSPSAAEEANAFGPWAVEFRGRFVQTQARCSPPEGATKEQAVAVREGLVSIRRALDLSEIQATHWSRHLGPALDESAEALQRARRQLR